MRICPSCKNKLNDNVKFCGHCGFSVATVTEIPQSEKEIDKKENTQSINNNAEIRNDTMNTAKGINNPFVKKCIIFGGAGIAGITVMIILIVVFISAFVGKNDNKKNNFVMYVKDEEVFLNNLKKDSESWQVTSRLIDFENVDNNTLYKIASYNMTIWSRVSNDGKYLFFADKFDNQSNYYFNLYYREIDKEDSENIKIDSEVRYYCINDNSTLVTYTKGEDGNLYQYSIKDETKEKIANNVSNLNVSDDGKTIIYTDEDFDLYRIENGKDKEKLVSGISSIEYISSDFKTVYYEKDDSLYFQKAGEDRIKIDSDIYDVVMVYDTGEIYYVTRGETIKYLDNCILYYFDGNESKMITDTYYHRHDDELVEGTEELFVSENVPIISYVAYDSKEEHINTDRYIAVKDSVTIIEPEKEMKKCIINETGTLIYYIDNVSDEDSYGDLYQITINKGKVGEPHMYDSDVMIGGCEFVDNTRIKYFKDYSKFNTADLYINKERIDYDVYGTSVLVKSDKVIYMTDYDDEKYYGTLKIYEDEKAEKVADDVFDYCMTPDGRILYLYDYSMKYYKGALYVWEKGEKTKIDDDVVSIIDITGDKYRRFSYGY